MALLAIHNPVAIKLINALATKFAKNRWGRDKVLKGILSLVDVNYIYRIKLHVTIMKTNYEVSE